MEEGQINRKEQGQVVKDRVDIIQGIYCIFPVIVKYFQVKKEEEKAAL